MSSEIKNVSPLSPYRNTGTEERLELLSDIYIAERQIESGECIDHEDVKIFIHDKFNNVRK